MPSEKEVYEAHAEQYQQLVQREDYEGNILREIQNIIQLDNVDVIELGAGTGRLTRLLGPHVRTIKAFDSSAHMLQTAKKSLAMKKLTNWQIGVADHLHIPVDNSSADLVISGWSFCYLAVWGGDSWNSNLDEGLKEIKHILRPGGKVIILETLGTATEKPNPPEHLSMYFNWLTKSGFEHKWMRTDYCFNSLTEAIDLSTFFFGAQMGEKIREHNWVILPECTGIWWKSG